MTTVTAHKDDDFGNCLCSKVVVLGVDNYGDEDDTDDDEEEE